MPRNATTRPGLRRSLRKKIRINPVIEIKQSAAAERSIKSDHAGPVSRPLCKSFRTATRPWIVSLILQSPEDRSLRLTPLHSCVTTIRQVIFTDKNTGKAICNTLKHLLILSLEHNFKTCGNVCPASLASLRLNSTENSPHKSTHNFLLTIIGFLDLVFLSNRLYASLNSGMNKGKPFISCLLCERKQGDAYDIEVTDGDWADDSALDFFSESDRS